MRGQAFLSIDTDVLAFFIFACAPGAPPIERRSADTRPGALDVLDMHDDETSADDWQHRFAREYGPWRTVVAQVAEEFLACGVLEHGFARIRCDACAHEYLLAFSCKCRYFCPSCHAKRLAIWTQWLDTTLLAPVPHRQVVLTIPKRLRAYCLYRRRLLGEIARVAARTVTAAIRTLTGERELAVGIVACLQTHGSRANWHPLSHLPRRDAHRRVPHPAIGDRPDPHPPPHPRLARGPRRRAKFPLDPGTGRAGRPTTTRGGAPASLSITPTARPRAGTFGVGVRPTGASDRSLRAPAPPRGPRSGRPTKRASGAAGTPTPVCRSSRGG